MARAAPTPGRNDPCPCGSGRKFKRCCGPALAAAPTRSVAPAPLSATDIGGLVALVEQGRLGDAEHRSRTLLASHPGAGIVWKVLGVSLLRQGNDAQALPALQRAAQLLPDDAEAHGNLGLTLNERGHWPEGLASLHRSLALAPGNPQILVAAADACRALGRTLEAVALYERTLALAPRHVEARNNLGNAFLELRRIGEAADCYRQALELEPDRAQIHCNLGNAQRQMGHLEAALRAHGRAIALDPALSVAHNGLGLVLAMLGRREEAVESYRRALSLDAHHPQVLNNLGNVLRDSGRLRDAATLYSQAIQIDPRSAESHCNLGNVLLESRRIDAAADSLRRALSLDATHAPAHLGLAAVFRQQGRPADAAASCRAALAQAPRSAEALALLGELEADHGRFVEAERCFRQAMAIDPGSSAAFSGIAAHRKMTTADADWLEAAEALLARGLTRRHEVALCHALGKYFDDVGQYDRAFTHFHRANELAARDAAGYDREALRRRIDRTIGAFDDSFLQRSRGHGSASELPLFIIGMPRSGTTLAEQILASHPAVFGAGELTFWEGAFSAYQQAGLATSLLESPVPDMAARYLERLQGLSAGAQRVIDKMPANFLYAGLIHAMFPQARIIHMRRHPLDTCLSIYFQNFFNMGAYSHDLEHLAHYYGEYLRLTDHWRATLPASRFLEVPYEALIEDQEGWTRRMLDFVGLAYDARCLQFHRTDRVVITASKWQVRQQLHGGSIDRWRNYEKHLGPLRRLVVPTGPPQIADC